MGEVGSSEVWRSLLLLDYNTRLVVVTTTLLGIASGVVGSFLLLRKRSLMGDALSHATLPGIAITFMVLVAFGQDGKQLGWLLLGAFTTGILGCLLVRWITNHTKIKDDTAMGIVLSVFFGAGVALLGLIQRMPEGNAAGLESYIYGKTASMVLSDFLLITVILLIVLSVCLLLYKEFRLLCFDPAFAKAQGWSIQFLDILLLLLVALVTVAGLQSVGLILMIAFLITPAASARMWTFHFRSLLVLAGAMGGLSGWVGATMSALLPKMPSGAVIVLVSSAIFVLSLLFGRDRGVFLRWKRMRSLRTKIELQHIMRAIYEILETQTEGEVTAQTVVSWETLLSKRSWSASALQKILHKAYQEAWLQNKGRQQICFTEEGVRIAKRITKNHRLWELYLIKFADVAPNHVDRDADNIEHVLGKDMTAELERLFEEESKGGLPSSPHPI